MVPSRRRVLGSAAAGVAALAGCQSFGTGCTHRISLQLERSTVYGIVARDTRAPADLHPISERLVRAAHESGGASIDSVAGPPVPEHTYVAIDGTFFDVLTEVVEETTVTGYVFDVSMDADATATGEESSVAFDDLPEHDQRGFLAGVGYPTPRKLEGAEGMSGEATIAYADPALVESSVLVPDPRYDYVRLGDRHYRLEKTGTEDAVVATYEVTLAAVADTEVELAAHVRDTHGVVLRSSELSDEQREILEAAREGEYSECDEFSPALESLQSRLEDARYARYDGAWYHVEVGETMA